MNYSVTLLVKQGVFDARELVVIYSLKCLI
jgi:hypothetical protein